MRFRHIVLAAALALPLAGCHSTSAPPPPLVTGALNQFDQASFQALMAVQATLNSLKTSIEANTALAYLKPTINQAITDYNTAQLAYSIYHGAASADNQQILITAIQKVQADVTGLQGAISK